MANSVLPTADDWADLLAAACKVFERRCVAHALADTFDPACPPERKVNESIRLAFGWLPTLP